MKALSFRSVGVTAAVAVLGLLFYLRPYYGIRHDAILYLGQGLLRLDPANFKPDLFFAFGSQASYTVLPQFLGRLLGQTNASELFFWLTAAGLAFFALASAALLLTLYSPRLALLGMLALCVLPPFYGGVSIFSLAEPFFTGRSFAEPLGLLAIVAYLRQRFAWAAMATALAFVVHPLQAIPLVMIAWFDLVRQDRRWGWSALTLLVPLAASALGIPGLPQVGAQFDPEWLSISMEASPHAFISLWNVRDWVSLAVDVFLIGILVRTAPHAAAKRLGLAALAMTASSIVLTYIGVDLFGSVLMAGLQLWRAHWILHWMAMASVPLVLLAVWQERDAFHFRSFLLVLIVTVSAPNATLLAQGVVAAPLVLLFLGWPHIERHLGSPVRLIVVALLAMVFVVLLLKLGVAAYDQYTKLGGDRSDIRVEFFVLQNPLVIGLLVILMWAKGPTLFQRIAVPWRSRTALIAALVILIIAAGSWDRRNRWTQDIEAAASNPGLFGATIPVGEQVFWESELLAPWLILGRPSYYSGAQASGVIFNRQTAIEVSRRREALKLIEFQARVCQMFNELNGHREACLIDISAARKICNDSRGQLGYLVLESKIDSEPLGQWTVQGGFRGRSSVHYYLYACKALAA